MPGPLDQCRSGDDWRRMLSCKSQPAAEPHPLLGRYGAPSHFLNPKVSSSRYCNPGSLITTCPVPGRAASFPRLGLDFCYFSLEVSAPRWPSPPPRKLTFPACPPIAPVGIYSSCAPGCPQYPPEHRTVPSPSRPFLGRDGAQSRWSCPRRDVWQRSPSPGWASEGQRSSPPCALRAWSAPATILGLYCARKHNKGKEEVKAP